MCRNETLNGMRRCGVLSALLGLLVGLTACAQLLGGHTETPPNRFYLITAESVRSFLKNSERPYPFQVQIKTFDVQRAYNRNEIIFRRDRYELQRDPFHSWAVRPGDMITDAIQQYFRAATLFTQMGGDRSFLDQRPDFILSGKVKVLERYDSGDIWAARLAMSMELMRQGDAQVIWRADFDKERQVFNPDMSYTVAAFSEILRVQMEQYIREIDFVFLNMKRGRAGTPFEPFPAVSDTGLAASSSDTTDHVSTDTSDYELIPGKLVP